jgi:hypothetical protein
LTVIDERRPSLATTTSSAERNPDAAAVKPTSTVHVALAASTMPALHCPERTNSFASGPSNSSEPIVTVALVMFLSLTRCVVDGVPIAHGAEVDLRQVGRERARRAAGGGADELDPVRLGLVDRDRELAAEVARGGRRVRHLHVAGLAGHERRARAAAGRLVRGVGGRDAADRDRRVAVVLELDRLLRGFADGDLAEVEHRRIEHRRPALWPGGGPYRQRQPRMSSVVSASSVL